MIKLAGVALLILISALAAAEPRHSPRPGGVALLDLGTAEQERPEAEFNDVLKAVTGESLSNLSKVRDALLAYITDTGQREALGECKPLLKEVYGAARALPLDTSAAIHVASAQPSGAWATSTPASASPPSMPSVRVCARVSGACPSTVGGDTNTPEGPATA